MGQSSLGDHSQWVGEPKELVVVCVDLYNSMDSRRTRSALPRSATFLHHNYLLYQCFQEWCAGTVGRRAGIDLVNFVGDAGLTTFSQGFGESALAFACDVIERLRGLGFQSAAGIDVGEVAVVDLADLGARTVGTRHAVGFPVDRAVRLSWIARPGEVLATASLTSAMGPSDDFELLPSVDPVGVSLDKWPSEQVELCGEVFVHSVHRKGGTGGVTSARPRNTARLVQYFNRLQLNALDFLRESPGQWATVVGAFQRPDRWNRVEVLRQFLETLDHSHMIDDGQIPEVEAFRPSDPGPIEAFSAWRDGMIRSVESILRNYHETTVSEIEKLEFERSMDKVVGELVVFSRASLRKLEMAI